LRIDDTTDPVDVDLCRLAATVVGVPLEVLIDDTAVVARLRDEQPPAVLRDLGAPSEQLGRAASEAGIDIDRRTPVALGEVELLHWSREQSVSETRHRYGNLRRSKTTSDMTRVVEPSRGVPVAGR